MAAVPRRSWKRRPSRPALALPDRFAASSASRRARLTPLSKPLPGGVQGRPSDVCRMVGHSPRSRSSSTALTCVETHTVASSCALAARGVGVAIVNERLAQAYVRDQTVLGRFNPDILHEHAFVVSSSVKPSRLAEEFLRMLSPAQEPAGDSLGGDFGP